MLLRNLPLLRLKLELIDSQFVFRQRLCLSFQLSLLLLPQNQATVLKDCEFSLMALIIFKIRFQLSSHSFLNKFAFFNFQFAIYNTYLSIFLIILPGFPATIAFGGTSLVTRQFAPMMAFSPIVTSHMIVAPDPMEAPFLTTVGRTTQSASVCGFPPPLVALGYLSLMKVTLWPMKTSSSMVTPSQMKVWLEILQFFPILAFF